MATFGSGTPESPDNKSIRAQLEELKKLNSSTASYNKLIVGIALVTLIVSAYGVWLTSKQTDYAKIQTRPILDEFSRNRAKNKAICSRSYSNDTLPGSVITCGEEFPELFKKFP